MTAPLTGIRILDLTTVVMGPTATQSLGDFGAEVIKVEPLKGDTLRLVGSTRHRGMSAGFLQMNRNKRSIALDLQTDAGKSVMHRLIARSEVLVYNVRPASMKRLGLSYEEVAALKPDIIYAGMFGFGEDGPYAGRPAYDDLIQAASGMASLMAHLGNDGVPRYIPLTIADRVTGQAGVTAILAALLHRERTGRGQSVEIPMFETMVPFVLGDHFGGHLFQPPEGPMGYERLLARSRVAFPTADGHVAAVIYTDEHWRKFFALCGQPERFERDERLKDLAVRTRNIEALYAELGDMFRGHTTAKWLELLAQADIPAAPVNTLNSLLKDPHLNAVGFFRPVEHPTEGTITEMAPVGKWSDSPPVRTRHAPALGQHTREILQEVGFGAEEIRQITASGAALAASDT